MQVGSVSYANLVESRSNSSPVPTSGETELKSQGSSLPAPTEPDKNNSSGRQSEQKPSEQQVISQLTDDERQLIKELAARDQEVRTHEQAHKSAGGQYAGSASFTYQRGPDGINYAIGGEVPIDTSKIQGNPEATIQKADQIRRAALAPAEPSVQDRSVAALATQIKMEAQAELADLKAEAREKLEAERSEESSSEESTDSQNDVNDTSVSQPFLTSSQENSEDESNNRSDNSSAQEDGESGSGNNSDTGVQFIDASLSPTDLENLLSADIARRNALAVFENINREPPKGNLDELV